MSSRIRLSYSVRWLYQRYQSISHSMKSGGGTQPEGVGHDNGMGRLGRMGGIGGALLGLALVEVAHSLPAPAQGRPGFISVGGAYRKNPAQQSASIEPEEQDEGDTVRPEDEPEPKDEPEDNQGYVPSWFESLSKKVHKTLHVHPDPADEALLHHIDRLCEEEDFETALEVLNSTRGDTVEHLWRRGRLLYQLAKDMPNGNERKQLILQGHDSLERAIQMDQDNFHAHFWMSPVVHVKAEMDGLVATANVAILMEKHLLALIRLKPEDPISHFSYGMWYFAIAEISWIEKLGASALGASLPNCTYEQALELFKKSEEVKPNFSILNPWMMGKTYLGMKDYENAEIQFKRALTMPAKKQDEIKAREESSKLLKKIQRYQKKKE